MLNCAPGYTDFNRHKLKYSHYFNVLEIYLMKIYCIKLDSVLAHFMDFTDNILLVLLFSWHRQTIYNKAGTYT